MVILQYIWGFKPERNHISAVIVMRIYHRMVILQTIWGHTLGEIISMQSFLPNIIIYMFSNRSCKETHWGEAISVQPLWEVFPTDYHLTKHLRILIGEKPYQCIQWDTTFSENVIWGQSCGRNFGNTVIVIRLSYWNFP